MSSDIPRAGLAKRIHAWILNKGTAHYEKLTRERKKTLLGGLRGAVLEIGPGTGPNLKFYAPEVRWIGVEPNPYMQNYLQREAGRLGREVDLRTLTAERLPAEDASMDAVVSTLVLCSVAEPDRVLAEVRRVLKPGGKFVYLEHVAAEPGSRLRWWQDFLRPLWTRLADGCHPNRETWKTIEAAGFAHVEQERFRLPLGPVGPQVAGVAVKAGGKISSEEAHHV